MFELTFSSRMNPRHFVVSEMAVAVLTRHKVTVTWVKRFCNVMMMLELGFKKYTKVSYAQLG